MSFDDLLALEFSVISVLYRSDDSCALYLRDIAGQLDEESAVVFIIMQRLIGQGDVSLVMEGENTGGEVLRPTEASKFCLTHKGMLRITSNSGVKVDKIVHVGKGGTYNEDSVNIVVGSYNELAGTYDEELAAALLRLEKIVRANGGSAGLDNFQAFVDEARSAEPKPAVLRSLWNGILQALPPAANVADIAVKVQQLWA